MTTLKDILDDYLFKSTSTAERGTKFERLIKSFLTTDVHWGKTNAITIAIHPLSGAEQLDDFNSQFGRLAVTGTRGTHGLLMAARSGLTSLRADAPARPGTPLGEPGTRALPRQTRQRILAAFRHGSLDLAEA